MSQISEDAVRLALATVREQLAAEVTEAIEKAVREERAAVVAWLRAECGSPGHEDRFCAYCNVRRNIAADIERGEHRREEKP
jgi:hypothetical protein